MGGFRSGTTPEISVKISLFQTEFLSLSVGEIKQTRGNARILGIQSNRQYICVYAQASGPDTRQIAGKGVCASSLGLSSRITSLRQWLWLSHLCRSPNAQARYSAYPSLSCCNHILTASRHDCVGQLPFAVTLGTCCCCCTSYSVSCHNWTKVHVSSYKLISYILFGASATPICQLRTRELCLHVQCLCY